MAIIAIMAKNGSYSHSGHCHFQVKFSRKEISSTRLTEKKILLFLWRKYEKLPFYTLKKAHGLKVIGRIFYHPKVKNANIFFGQCVPKSKNPTRDTVFDHPVPNIQSAHLIYTLTKTTLFSKFMTFISSLNWWNSYLS